MTDFGRLHAKRGMLLKYPRIMSGRIVCLRLASAIASKCGLSGKDGGEIIEYAPCKIVSVEFPLVKVWEMAGGNNVVNVASLAFISAREVE